MENSSSLVPPFNFREMMRWRTARTAPTADGPVTRPPTILAGHLVTIRLLPIVVPMKCGPITPLPPVTVPQKARAPTGVTRAPQFTSTYGSSAPLLVVFPVPSPTRLTTGGPHFMSGSRRLLRTLTWQRLLTHPPGLREQHALTTYDIFMPESILNV